MNLAVEFSFDEQSHDKEIGSNENSIVKSASADQIERLHNKELRHDHERVTKGNKIHAYSSKKESDRVQNKIKSSKEFEEHILLRLKQDSESFICVDDLNSQKLVACFDLEKGVEVTNGLCKKMHDLSTNQKAIKNIIGCGKIKMKKKFCKKYREELKASSLNASCKQESDNLDKPSKTLKEE